jgi:hypothetical protein
MILSGKLYDRAGQPVLAPVLIRVTSQDPTAAFHASTYASDGQYVINNVPAGMSIVVNASLDCGPAVTRTLDTRNPPGFTPTRCQPLAQSAFLNFGGPTSAADPDAASFYWPSFVPKPCPTSGGVGTFTYAIEPRPPEVSGFSETIAHDGQPADYQPNILILDVADDREVARIATKYGLQPRARGHLIGPSPGDVHAPEPYLLVDVPTPDQPDLTDLPRLAEAAKLEGRYTFYSYAGAALYLMWLRLRADGVPASLNSQGRGDQG